jgi:hypothetical protein
MFNLDFNSKAISNNIPLFAWWMSKIFINFLKNEAKRKTLLEDPDFVGWIKFHNVLEIYVKILKSIFTIDPVILLLGHDIVIPFKLL